MTKVLRYSAALLLVTALSLLVGGSAAAQSTNNPRYRQFRDTAAASISTPAANNVRLFFDSTGFYWKNSAGVSTAVGGSSISGTAGVIPAIAAGGTTLEDSKMTTTTGGTSTGKGVWTLYDNTAVTGETRLVLRQGAVLTGKTFEMVRSDGTTSFFSVDDTGGGGVVRIPGGSLDISATAYLGASGMRLYPSGTINWTAGSTVYEAFDIGLARSAAGIIKVTDGSTGYGMLRASGLGVGTAPVTADGLNITATTGMTSNLRLVGTSGIINPIITFVDVGPTTGSITWQSPAMELRGGSGHYMSLNLSSTPAILFGDNANDAGIEWVEGSTLKITDASTGSGGIGIADSATNTVTDALVLRHATSGTAAASFGTGLLFQGENAAGTMHDMASIDAVYANAADTTEQTHLVFKNYHLGAEATFLTMWQQFGETYLAAPGFLGLNGSSVRIQAQAASPIYFATANADRWLIDSSGHLQPDPTNTYDIGTSSAVVREIFGRALTSDLNLVLGAGNVDQIVMGSTYFGTTGSAVNTLNLGYVGAEFASAYVSTSIQGTREKTLGNDNALTNVTQISSAVSDRAVAGYIDYTVTVSDTTNHLVQMETASVPFLLVNENGTVTATIGTVYGSTKDNAGGAAITNTWSATVTGTNVMIEVTCDYDAATLTGTIVKTIQSRVHINSGTATVTPQ